MHVPNAHVYLVQPNFPKDDSRTQELCKRESDAMDRRPQLKAA
jgi:hypothetical protein